MQTRPYRRFIRLRANIAEAWGKRGYVGHFVSKLTDSDSEQYETQHWIETAVECKYVDPQRAALLIDKCKEVGRLLGGMMEKADLFCGASPKTLRESAVEYFVQSSDAPIN
ncbi:MAG: four helix bundle protein [Chloroflexota bacterium]